MTSSSPSRVPCPKCGADPYKKCRLGFGDWLNGRVVHSERMFEVLDRLAAKLDQIDSDLSMTEHTAENDAHAGCQKSWEKQRRQSDFTEARLSALVVGFRQLAQAMDRCDGHGVYAELGGKTFGGSIRWLLRDLEDGRVNPPEGPQP